MASEKAVPTMSFHLLTRGRVGSGNLHRSEVVSAGQGLGGVGEELEGSGMTSSVPTLLRMGVVVSQGTLTLLEGDSGKNEVFSRLQEEEEGKLSGR